jgi:hypothetical protein
MPEDNKPAVAPKPQAEAPQHKTRDTVWVICKLPHGLTIYPEVEKESDAPDASGKRRTVWVEVPEQRVKLNGANSSTVVGRSGRILGYGMTEVDRGFWERWISQHKDFPAVKNGMIASQETRERAMSAAMENKSLLTGFEQIEPNAPSDQPGVVSTDEAYAAAAGMGSSSISR